MWHTIHPFERIILWILGHLQTCTTVITLSFILFLIFIGVQSLHNIVLVSTVRQSESAIHLSPLFWISFPFRSPQSLEQSSLFSTVVFHQLSILYIVSIVYACPSQSPSSSRLPFPPWCPYVCSVRQCLYLCFVNEIVCTHARCYSLVTTPKEAPCLQQSPLTPLFLPSLPQLPHPQC